MLFIAIICALWYKSASDRSTERTEKTTVIPASRISSPKGLTKVLENTVDGTTLYGNLIFAQSWGNDSSPMGIYKFNTTDNPKAELVYRSEAGPIGANGGATLVDAKYFYCITYTKLSGTTISNEIDLLRHRIVDRGKP